MKVCVRLVCVHEEMHEGLGEGVCEGECKRIHV